jgi:DNA polymerase elongation subunit (family B)
MNSDIYSNMINQLPQGEGNYLFVVSSPGEEIKVVLLSKKVTSETRNPMNKNGIIRLAQKSNEVYLQVHEKHADALRSKNLHFGDKKVIVQVLTQEEYDKEFASILASLTQEKREYNLDLKFNPEAEGAVAVSATGSKVKSSMVADYSVALAKDEILEGILESIAEEVEEEKRIAKEEEKAAIIKQGVIKREIREKQILKEETSPT